MLCFSIYHAYYTSSFINQLNIATNYVGGNVE